MGPPCAIEPRVLLAIAQVEPDPSRENWTEALQAAKLDKGRADHVMKQTSCLKQRRRELLRVERLQIVRLFAEADEFDWQAQFLLNRDDHAAFARAVEFGDDQPRELHRFVEFT